MFSATSSMSLDSRISIDHHINDFKQEENILKLKGVFRDSMAKVLAQVHVTMTAREDALDHVESLIIQLLILLCGKPVPYVVQDVEDKVEKTLPHPINRWAIREARSVLEKGRKRAPILLPLDRVHTLLSKELFQHKIDFQVSLYIVAVLEYIAGDILTLVGKYKKNQHADNHAITTQDIRTAMSADQVLLELFEPDDGAAAGGPGAEEEPPGSLSYDDAVRELVLEERIYLRNLNLIIKVFRAQIQSLEQATPQDVDAIFSNIMDVYECTVTVLGQMEDTLEMSGGGAQISIGSCFEELAEDSEFDVYERYSREVLQPVCRDRLLAVLDRAERHDGVATAGHGFREAVKYVLPKLLLLPVAHVLKYFDNIKMLHHLCECSEEQEVLVQVQGMLTMLQVQLERIVSNSGVAILPKRRLGDPFSRNSNSARHASIQKMYEVQRSIDGWEGRDISQSGCSEFVKEGVLGKVGSGKKLTERFVFLFDGLIVLCKHNARRSSVVSGPLAEFRLKEKLQIRKLTVLDRDDSDELRHSFEISPRTGPGMILFAKSAADKNEWMANLIMLTTRSMLERSLDMLLLDEQKKNPLRLPDADLYCFSEPDSPDNIVLEQLHSGVPIIKGATLTKLVERLTYHMYADLTFVRTFLTTFRSFCTAQELLTLLMKRYDIPDPSTMSDLSPVPVDFDDVLVKPTLREDVKRFRKEYSQPVKFRVLNVLRHWVDHHFYDFERDPDLLVRLQHFISGIKVKVMRKWADSILKIIDRKTVNAVDVRPEVVFGIDRSPPATEWHLIKSEDDWQLPADDLVRPLLMLHPIELGRQLTLLEFDLYRAVKPSELVGSVWTKQNKRLTSPNLLRMIRHNTNVTRWLERCVLDTDNVEERRAVVLRMVELLVLLQELNNFSGVLEVVAALDSAAVHRLALTFEEIPPKLDRALEDARELCSDHYKRYQEKLRSINPPCVPFFGMYLTNILHIDEGNPDFLFGSDRLVNYSKRRKVAEITGEIQQYQNQPYCLRPVPRIREFLEGLRPFDEGVCTEDINNYLYNRSLAIEPRNCRTPPKWPRSWPDLVLKSPGIKPRRSNVPHPLQGLRAASSLRLHEDGEPETPPTPSSPLTHISSENTVFAHIIVGSASSGSTSGVQSPRSPHHCSVVGPAAPPLPPRRRRQDSVSIDGTVRQAPDAPLLPPRNSSPPPRPPRRDLLLSCPPATLPRRPPPSAPDALMTRMSLSAGPVVGSSGVGASSSLSARDHSRVRSHFTFNFDETTAPFTGRWQPPSPTTAPTPPPKPYRHPSPSTNTALCDR